MTIPQLIKNYQGFVLQTQFKKSYSVLSNAYMMTKSNLGVTNIREVFAVYDYTNKVYTNANIFREEFYKNLNVKKQISMYPFTNYSGTKTTSVDKGSDFPKATRILPDGSSIGVWVVNHMILFWVDTNGPYKGPNRYGFDIFEFQVRDKTDQILPVKMSRKYTEEELEEVPFPDIQGSPCSINAKTQAANGKGCSWYALNDTNPDDESKSYWKNLPK